MARPDATSGKVKLSILIVNYNGGQLVEACLNSIAQYPPDCPFEVIVLDNASTDKSPERIERNHAAGNKTIQLIRLPENLGLAKAFNRGLEQARGDFVLSLDNDTRVLENSLTDLVAFFESCPAAGAVGSRIFDPDMTLQKTARRKPSAVNALFGRRSLLTRWFPNNPISKKYLMEDQIGLQQPYEVDWLSTAALMVRREVLDSVGGLDESFFVYWVDADWCARIKKGGWAIYVVPASKIIHDENLRSTNRNRPSTRMVIDFHKGAYRYYRNNHLRFGWSPMALLTAAGLLLRASLLLTFYSIKDLIRSNKFFGEKNA